jgi:hypothetical protein
MPAIQERPRRMRRNITRAGTIQQQAAASARAEVRPLGVQPFEALDLWDEMPTVP